MNKRTFLLLCLLFSLATLTAQGYIKFEGIDGEATEPAHMGWSNITSFSVGMTNAVSTMGPMGGRATGKVSFGDLVITKVVDKSSPKLMETSVKGITIPKVELHLVNKTGGGKPTVYYRYELKNVLISSYQISGDTSGSGVPPTEQISLSYGGISVFYTEMDESGKSKGEIPFKWDIKANKAGN